MLSMWFCESRSCSTAAAAAAAEAGCGAADPSARRVVLNAAHCTWEMLDITLARMSVSPPPQTDAVQSDGLVMIQGGGNDAGRIRCSRALVNGISNVAMRLLESGGTADHAMHQYGSQPSKTIIGHR